MAKGRVVGAVRPDGVSWLVARVGKVVGMGWGTGVKDALICRINI